MPKGVSNKGKKPVKKKQQTEPEKKEMTKNPKKHILIVVLETKTETQEEAGLIPRDPKKTHKLYFVYWLDCTV